MLILLYIFSIIVEVSNDFFSQKLFHYFSIPELLFIRSIWSAIFSLIINKFQLNLSLVFKIIICFGCIFFIKYIFKNFDIINLVLLILGFIIASIIFVLFFKESRKNLFIFLYKDWNLLSRTILTLSAFLLTMYGVKNLSLYSISCSYYSIPLFAALLSLFFFKNKISKKYIIEIVILSSFVLMNLNVNAWIMLLGCFCFALCDVLLQKSEKSILQEMLYINIGLTLYLFVFCDYNTVFHKVTSIQNYNFIFLFGLMGGGVLIQFLIFNVFKNIDFCKLIPYRFLGLLYSNILENRIFHWINLAIICMILFELFEHKFRKNK